MQTIELIYPTAETAFMRFGQLLRNSGFAILNSIPKHNFRHRLIQTPNIDFYCLYRKESVQNGTFEKFNEYFESFVNEHTEFRGHAESINKEVIESVCRESHDPTSDNYDKDIVLIYIYKDTKIYLANPFIFKKFAEKHNLIREHKSVDIKKEQEGEYSTFNETTYHLPFNEMFFINFNKWIKQNGAEYLFD